jgi:type VI protein secretion system component Hcp
MAEYGIVVGIKDIKGNCQLEGYKEQILGESVSFGSSQMRTQTGGGVANTRTSVEQSPVTLSIAAGKWTAELLQALYVVKRVGDVVITQLGQSVDKNSTAAPTVIQKLTLTNAVITGCAQAWMTVDGPRTLTLSLEFDKILLEIGGKPADFTLRNITAGAK